MNCRTCLEKILALLLILFLLDESYAHNWYGRNNHQANKECPGGTRCVPKSNCSSSMLQSLRGPPERCGYYYISKKICCPEKRQSTRPPPFVSRFSPTTRTPIIPTDCGKVNGLQGKNAGIKPAKQGAWPWMVEIAKRNHRGKFIHICAGFLITRRHVLSAAHCFQQKKLSLYVARIGHVNRNLARDYKISRINKPDTFKRNRYYDDIAVLTLSDNVNIKNVGPLCLPPSPEYVNLTGNSTTSVGWGSTKPKSHRSTILMELPGIPVISNPRCGALFRQKLKRFRQDFPRGISDGLICAGFLKSGRGSCWGESGEPMMYQRGGRWYAVGVLSFGVHLDCHQPGIPTGYTRVSKYLNWILKIIKP